MDSLDFVLNNGNISKCFKESEAVAHLKDTQTGEKTFGDIVMEVDKEYARGKAYYIFVPNTEVRESTKVREVSDFYHSAEEAVEDFFGFLKTHGF